MVTKSRLKMALAAEKGTDFKKLKEKKQQKAALKEKASREAARGATSQEKEETDEDEDEENIDVENDEEEGEEEDEDLERINLGAIDESDSSQSSIELEERIPRKPKSALKANGKTPPNVHDEPDSEEQVEEDDEEDIPISDLESLADSDKEDLIPHTRLTINNTAALLSSLNRIALRTNSSVPFAAHQSVTSETPTADGIPDVSDDIQRELAFYSQSLAAVKTARAKLLGEGVPFSRAKDYFAEMVKEDAHMDKVKAKLVEEASNKKAAAEARKQRDLKKFGKAVQVAKMQERQKEKKETLDKIKSLKRKRAESNNDLNTTEADLFDVGVESELSKPSSRSGSGRDTLGRGSHKPNAKRQQKNEKYGFGGKKKHAKSGDAMSSGDLSGFNAKGMKASSGGGRGGGRVGKTQRPGKARRKAMKG